jgi:hypothetical protein
MRKTTVLAAGLLLAAAAGLRAQAPSFPSEFKNLQVLDKTTPSAQLKATMEGFTEQLGVKCSFCHVPDQWEKDDNRHKLAARKMLALVQFMKANKDKYFKANVKNDQIDCGICHRGKNEPEPFTP